MKYVLIKRIIVSLILISCFSCVNTRKAVYFVDQGDLELAASNMAPPSVISVNDILSITITSLSSPASNTFNDPNNPGPGGSGSGAQLGGYLVAPDGNIKFPVLGKIKAAGLTEAQLEDWITKELLDRKLLLDPIVTIRHLNFKVTVLGEVAEPKVINVPNEKISLLEAIGMAGDLTIYAKRNNVLLIREQEGKKLTKRLDLNSPDFLSSPYYYLKSNDVIYVEPNSTRVASTSNSRFWIPVFFSILSFGAIVVDRLTR